MILSFGNISTFGSMQWYMVELRSEKTIEGILRRLGQSISEIFRDSAVELFIPIYKRDLNTIELSTGSYIFARSPTLRNLLRMREVTGVVGLVMSGDSKHPSKALAVDDSYVQELITNAEAEFLQRAHSIEVGSFVRILDGEMRDWCGTVTGLHDGSAAVRVEIKTKTLLVETPVRNLLDKSSVPEHLRVFYYGDLVEELEHHGLANLVTEDLHYVPEEISAEDGLEAPAPKKLGRQQTVTALVKRMIVTGTLDPKVIGTEVLNALKAGSLKAPKNLSIVHGVIKSRLIEDYFQLQDSEISTYRDVVERFGEQYRFTLNDLIQLDPGTGIPVTTEETQEQAGDTQPEEVSA